MYTKGTNIINMNPMYTNHTRQYRSIKGNKGQKNSYQKVTVKKSFSTSQEWNMDILKDIIICFLLALLIGSVAWILNIPLGLIALILSLGGLFANH